jgi:putative DNA primase/helicase
MLPHKIRKSELPFDSVSSMPTELTDLRQWVMWNYGIRHGKATKIPYTIYRQQASTTNPKTWTTYSRVAETLARKNCWYAGIGFVFTKDDPYCGIDLDHCVENGIIQPWAQEIVDYFDTDTRPSPSGTGLHLILRAVLPEGKGKRSGPIEVYDRGRYFTMGENVLGHGGIRDCQRELDEWYKKLWPTPEAVAPEQRVAAPTFRLSNADIWRIAFNARNAAKLADLYSGTWQPHYNSQSEADIALVAMLAFYTQDKQQLQSLFEESGLYRKKPNGMRAKYTDYWYSNMFHVATSNLRHTYKG